MYALTEEHPMDPVIHFELPYVDAARVAAFYQRAFGWHTEALGDAMNGYVLATTADSDEEGPRKPGAINGGFFEKNADWPAQFPSVVIAVQDVERAMVQVRQAGGQVLGEPMQIPGVGRYVSFIDTEGNRGSMLQQAPRAGQGPA
ncbi:MAG: glyoxalase/bleomycin resistance protein/dioxygenase [Acidimicrobiaceae bacterium]|nr:MAG: glyoxalase/bleomycin resistance protein/dioxygenase [Acidimicrobiaceae bacterium]